ncbi:zinc finger BED domain-containing protein 1-like protein, partial [Lates japonicus]
MLTPSLEVAALRQTSPGEFSQARSVNRTTTTKLTNTIAKWLATDCRPINTVEDKTRQQIAA